MKTQLHSTRSTASFHDINTTRERLKSSLSSLREAMVLNSTREPTKTLNSIYTERIVTEPISFNSKNKKIYNSNRRIINQNYDMIDVLRSSRKETSEPNEERVKIMSVLPTAESIESNIQSIKESNISLKNEYDMKNKALIHSENEKKRTMGEIERMKEKLEKVALLNLELKHNYKDIESKFTNESDLLDCEYIRLQKENSTFKHNESVLYEMNNNLLKSKEDYEVLIKKMKNTLIILKEKNKKTSSDLDTLKLKIDDLDKEHSKKDSQIEELLDIQKELVENNTLNQNEIDNLSNEKNSKDQILEKVQKVQTNIDEYAQKIKDLYAEIADKERVIEKIKLEYEQLNQELIAYPHNKKTPNKEVDEKKKELKVNLEKEKEKNKGLTTTLTELNGITETLIESKEKMKKLYESEIENLKQEYEKKKNQLSSTKDIDEEFKKIMDDNQTLKAKNEELVSKIKQLPDLQKEFKELIDTNLSLKQENLLLNKKKQLESILKQKEQSKDEDNQNEEEEGNEEEHDGNEEEEGIQNE